MAINAGNDIVTIGNNLNYRPFAGRDANRAIVKSVRDGKIKKSRIRESYNRIMKMKRHLAQQQNIKEK